MADAATRRTRGAGARARRRGPRRRRRCWWCALPAWHVSCCFCAARKATVPRRADGAGSTSWTRTRRCRAARRARPGMHDMPPRPAVAVWAPAPALVFDQPSVCRGPSLLAIRRHLMPRSARRCRRCKISGRRDRPLVAGWRMTAPRARPCSTYVLLCASACPASALSCASIFALLSCRAPPAL